MFILKASTPIGGDCSRAYDVILDKEYTVEDFINVILSERFDEWGSIEIYELYRQVSRFSCEYKYGKMMASSLPDEYLRKKIFKVSAHGGYTRMDYTLLVDESVFWKL